jgi:hypothetical protein
MTTKTTYAMFAVAAIAAASFSMTPAFADWQVNWSEEVEGYDTNTYWDLSWCGNKIAFTDLKIAEHDPGTEDIVQVETDASRCYSHHYSAVTVTIEKNGNQVLQQTGNDAEEVFTYPGPLVGGDDIDVTVQYYS